jgi:hypothetical protein
MDERERTITQMIIPVKAQPLQISIKIINQNIAKKQNHNLQNQCNSFKFHTQSRAI